MNLQNFKEVYTKIITESTDDSELKQYIKKIVEEVLNEEYKILISKKIYPKLHAAIRDIADYLFEKGRPLYSYRDIYDATTLDKFEKMVGTEEGSKNKELTKFLKGFAPKPYLSRSGNEKSDRGSNFDSDGYPVTSMRKKYVFGELPDDDNIH